MNHHTPTSRPAKARGAKPATLAQLTAAWTPEIVPAIGRQSVVLQSLMQYAYPSSMSEGEVVLAFPRSHQSMLTTIDHPANREVLEMVISRSLGLPLRVRLEVAENDADRIVVKEGKSPRVSPYPRPDQAATAELAKELAETTTVEDYIGVLEAQAAVLQWIVDLTVMPYREYLGSGHWQNMRRVALERAKSSCQVCNASDGLDVHHRTYQRRGWEKPSDLIVLCRGCHTLFHENRKLET